MGRTSESGPDPAEASASFAIPAVPPCHLEATVRVLQRRPTNRVNRWEEGRYLRVLASAEGLRLVAVENRGTIDAPDLRGLIFGGPLAPQTRDQLGAALRRILGPAIDPAPFYRLARRDARLHAVTALSS